MIFVQLCSIRDYMYSFSESAMNATSFDLDELYQFEDDTSTNFFILVVLEVIICITFIAGTILNTVLVILFFRRRGFRTLSNRFKIKYSFDPELTISSVSDLCSTLPCPTSSLFCC